MICSCSVIAEHEQIVSCCSVTNDHHVVQLCLPARAILSSSTELANFGCFLLAAMFTQQPPPVSTPTQLTRSHHFDVRSKSSICFLCCRRNPQNLSQSFQGVKTCFFILSECPAFTAVRCYSLPFNIRNYATLKSFKTALKTFMFSLEYWLF